MIALIVFFERAERKVSIQYPRNKALLLGRATTDNNYMPLKLNTAGVIPPMFASSLLLFPLTIANFATSQNPILEWLALNLGHGKPLFIVIYVILIQI